MTRWLLKSAGYRYIMEKNKAGDAMRNDLAAIKYRRLTIIVFCLFFAWLLAFPFEGRILYALADYYNVPVQQFVFGTMAAHFIGLILCGFLVKSLKAAKRLILGSIALCTAASGVFFLPPSFLWTGALLMASLMAGCSVAAWGFFLKSGTPKNERLKTMADGLIFSNILMILLNMTAINVSPHVGLGLSMLVLGMGFIFALKLPQKEEANNHEQITVSVDHNSPARIWKPLSFLCLFIVVITINSGLMYQVQGPAFSHLEWLTSWYWSFPYIAALFVMRNLDNKVNRAYILYVAIAMIGFSFIAFLVLDRSALGYLVVNTLMLGACGVYDLFWWSILGEMSELHKNPARVLGVGLSANVLGILLGGLIGNALFSNNMQSQNSTLLALSVVCVTLVMLPPLNKRLTGLLINHTYLTALLEMPHQEQTRLIRDFSISEKLTEREIEIASLLLTGKTYRMIAGELRVSENTIKTHVRNIYSKAGVQNRTELMNIFLHRQSDSTKTLESS